MSDSLLFFSGDKRVAVILLLYVTRAGRSTLATKLANHYGLELLEADDEVWQINDGVWPDREADTEIYFEQTTPKILLLDNVLYVIS